MRPSPLRARLPIEGQLFPRLFSLPRSSHTPAAKAGFKSQPFTAARKRRATQKQARHGQGASHFAPSLLSFSVAPGGGGRMGGRASPYFRFWTSISVNSIAGAAADTGTLPDSAPQIPLKTLVVSPVAAIRDNTVSGVPTISTPRTSLSGLPSA